MEHASRRSGPVRIADVMEDRAVPADRDAVASVDPTTGALAFALRAIDGQPLSAHRYSAAGARAGHVLIAGATGVPQRFYRAFARWMAAHGWTCWTLDYRGIGASRPASLRGFEVDYRDWAERDLAALVAAVPSDGPPLFVVGHSFGGQAFGLLPDTSRIAGLYTFATGAGWHGWMPWPERWRVLALWHLVAPVLVRRHGYLAWSRLGMGEDLPHGVYRDWKRWCGHPHYFFDEPGIGAELRERYARVRAPIVAANARDDAWAPPASRDAFMAAYARADVVHRDIDSVREGLGQIGHLGYFRPSAEPLWREVLAWMEGTASVR
jgi:predicted alpha/beta hydrolase